MKSKILTIILIILSIALIIVYIKLPAQRNKVKTVSKEEYKNQIYNEVYEIYGKKEEEINYNEVEENIVEDTQDVELNQDELYKMQ